MGPEKGKKITGALSGLAGLYVVYAFLTGALLFQFNEPADGNVSSSDPDRFYGNGHANDRVVLLEDREESGLGRIHLIENADESIDLSYFTLHDGLSADFLLSALVEAADRGVEVRILLDGLFHNLRGDLKEMTYALTAHPNIKLKFYEPFDAVRPWTWNNRLHDKMMIVDNKKGLVGGRNIGDKYFSPEGYEGASNDRDLLVINTVGDSDSSSVLPEMTAYFNELWEHHFSKKPVADLSKRQKKSGEETVNAIRKQASSLRVTYDWKFNREIDWLAKSLPVNKVTFIHNPIERLNKDPRVWRDLAALMENASESIVIQSPYLIPDDRMMTYINEEEIEASDIALLTNSLAATPNILAYSGYAHFREEMTEAGISVFEFQETSESLHAKTFIFDERITAVGSFNLDPRSTYLSTEVMLVVDSRELADLVIDKVDNYITYQSLQVSDKGDYINNSYVEKEEPSFGKSVLTGILSLFTKYFVYLL